MDTQETAQEAAEAARRIIDKEFFRRLFSHMAGEEQKFAEGSARMDRIEKDLQPIKKMYWAIVGSSVVGVLLLSLITFIYTDGRADFKEVQKAVLAQGNAIERLLSRQQEIDSTYRRDLERIERTLEMSRNNGSSAK